MAFEGAVSAAGGAATAAQAGAAVSTTAQGVVFEANQQQSFNPHLKGEEVAPSVILSEARHFGEVSPESGKNLSGDVTTTPSGEVVQEVMLDKLQDTPTWVAGMDEMTTLTEDLPDNSLPKEDKEESADKRVIAALLQKVQDQQIEIDGLKEKVSHLEDDNGKEDFSNSVSVEAMMESVISQLPPEMQEAWKRLLEEMQTKVKAAPEKEKPFWLELLLFMVSFITKTNVTVGEEAVSGDVYVSNES